MTTMVKILDLAVEGGEKEVAVVQDLILNHLEEKTPHDYFRLMKAKRANGQVRLTLVVERFPFSGA